MPGNCPALLHLLLLACGKHSAPSRTPFRQTSKTVRLPTGTVFAFRPECCSESHRNGVRLPTGIAFAFDRIPQLDRRNTRVASVRAAMEELVKLFKKARSKFYGLISRYAASDIVDQLAKQKP
jgi:hypothetical protein